MLIFQSFFYSYLYRAIAQFDLIPLNLILSVFLAVAVGTFLFHIMGVSGRKYIAKTESNIYK